jgi:LacI family transcriptional regulator
VHFDRVSDEADSANGDESTAAMIEPGLTTVGLHPYRIGQPAARLFLEQVQQKDLFQPRTFVIAGN